MLQSRLWPRHDRWRTLASHGHVLARVTHNSGTLKFRSYTTGTPAKDLVVHVLKSNVYRFGDSNIVAPVFRDLEWTIQEGQSWAVIGHGSGEKTALLQALCGHMRIAPPPPPPGGLFPFLSDPPRDAHTAVSLVSFAHRPSSAGNAFYGYTARYGAVREEDRITLRESVFGQYDFLNLRPKGGVSKTPAEHAADEVKKAMFDDLAGRLGLEELLDMPMVTLSNGQTRRARIVKAILGQPELLLLDEPLTGLDVDNRPTLLSVLRSLHEACRPRIIMGLRMQDPIPDWISHLALVSKGKVITGTKNDILDMQELRHAKQDGFISTRAYTASAKRVGGEAEPVVVMKNVNVSYRERKVLQSINWTIRPGERWHLQGANGSGKTTLLSLLTGDHPQSYTQRSPSHLTLFSRQRPRIPTPYLAAHIGVVSPELANAYPRRAGTTVREVVGTGFEGTFVPGRRNGSDGLGFGESEKEKEWRVQRVGEVLAGLGLRAWAAVGTSPLPSAGADMEVDEAFARRAFVELSPGEQSVVLLMRALVGRPPLVLLDEVWAGMDERMVRAARRYLRVGGVGPDQAVVVVSHWDDEVPWTAHDGLRRLRLKDGIGAEVGDNVYILHTDMRT